MSAARIMFKMLTRDYAEETGVCALDALLKVKNKT